MVCFLFTCAGFLTSVQAEPADSVHASQTAGTAQSSTLAALDHLISDFWHDTKSVVFAPIHWQKKDWLVCAGVGAVTFGLLATDRDVEAEISRRRSNFTDDLARLVTPLGSREGASLAMGGLYIGGVLFRHPTSRRAAWNSFKAVAISQGITQVLKHGLNRRRPGALQRPGHFDGPTWHSPETGLSFPSGHATTAFALASAISNTYRKPYVTIPAFTLAGTVALARLNDFVHFPADVFFAAAVATWVGQVVSLEKGERKVHVAVLSGGKVGFVLRF